MGHSSEADAIEEKYEMSKDRVEVSTKEIDTAAEFGSGEQEEVDPVEALRVRYASKRYHVQHIFDVAPVQTKDRLSYHPFNVQ